MLSLQFLRYCRGLSECSSKKSVATFIVRVVHGTRNRPISEQEITRQAKEMLKMRKKLTSRLEGFLSNLFHNYSLK